MSAELAHGFTVAITAMFLAVGFGLVLGGERVIAARLAALAPDSARAGGSASAKKGLEHYARRWWRVYGNPERSRPLLTALGTVLILMGVLGVLQSVLLPLLGSGTQAREAQTSFRAEVEASSSEGLSFDDAAIWLVVGTRGVRVREVRAVTFEARVEVPPCDPKARGCVLGPGGERRREWTGRLLWHEGGAGTWSERACDALVRRQPSSGWQVEFLRTCPYG